MQDAAVTPTQPSRIYHPGVRSQQQRRGYLPESTAGTTQDERRLTKNTQTLENFHPDPTDRAGEDAPEARRSWVDSKVFGVSVWIILPVIIFVVILGLVLGLKG